MNDLTHKIITFHRAVAEATVRVSREETMEAIRNGTVPKGNVFETSRVAGLLGIKRTSDLIPECHPVPIESAAITHSIEGLDIIIRVDVQAIYRTGVTMEALHGASVTALTVYDMLKPIDPDIEIFRIRLVEKKGGANRFGQQIKRTVSAVIIVCSDSVSAGKKEDAAGLAIREKLENFDVAIREYKVIPDEAEVIRGTVLAACDAGTDLVVLTGGTGLSPRDVTPEAIRPLLDREIPGIAEAARQYGQSRIPWAMLSRSLAGLRSDTLILALPGSTRGAAESMDALFPYVLHLFDILAHARHEGNQ